MLECVINLSEGTRHDLIDQLAAAGRSSLLDVHSDALHNRSVFTLGGENVIEDALSITRAGVSLLAIAQHVGAHPRLGVVDVVPFVPLDYDPSSDNLDEALAARNEVAQKIASELAIPCFFYGPERSLPSIRREAYLTLFPDFGPNKPHPTAGSCCVGARPPLVAYNLWLANPDFELAQSVVRTVRNRDLRCLAFNLDGRVQISCNLIAPWRLGPGEAFDLISRHVDVDQTELVGLLSESILRDTPRVRWGELDLAQDRTIEARLASRA